MTRKINPKEFITIWESAVSVSSVADHFGVTNKSATARASRYRRHGIALKLYSRGFHRSEDWDVLSKLCDSLKDTEGGDESREDTHKPVNDASVGNPNRPALSASELMKRPKQERDEAMKRGAEIMKDDYEGGEEQAANAADLCSPNAKPSTQFGKCLQNPKLPTRSSDTSLTSTRLRELADAEDELPGHLSGTIGMVPPTASTRCEANGESTASTQSELGKDEDAQRRDWEWRQYEECDKEDRQEAKLTVSASEHALDCEACNGSGNLCDPTQPPGKMWSTCPVCKGTRKMGPKE